MKSRAKTLLTPLAAAALAFGAQAFTSPLLDGFEDYAADSSVTNLAGWLYVTPSDGADASLVSLYPDGVTPPFTPHFASGGNQFLGLSTDDGILFRSINALDNGGLGTAVTPGAAGLAVDASMQFTLTDASDRPVPSAEDKFLLWLEAGAGTTNLMVCGGSLGTPTTPTVYKLAVAGVDIEPGAWHNVRITSKPNVNVPKVGVLPAAFEIAVDDVVATVAGDDAVTLLDGSTYVPSLSASAAIKAIGFSGEGKLDNLAVVDNANAGTTIHLVSSPDDEIGSAYADGTYTFTAPLGFLISSIAVNGVVSNIAPAVASLTWDSVPGADVVVAATKTRTAPEHKWFESPYVINTTYLTNTFNGSKAEAGGFKGGRDDNYFVFTYFTANGGYKMFDYDQLREGDAEPINALTAAQTNMIPGYFAVNALRGAAVSKALNVNFVMSYSPKDKMLSIPLDSTDAIADATVITNDWNYAFDSGDFSADGKYLFTNVLPDKSNPNNDGTNTMAVKWQVVNGLKGEGAMLKFVRKISAGPTGDSRIRHAQYARIDGKDLVYCVVDNVYDGVAGKAKTTGIKVVYFPDDDEAEPSVTTLCVLEDGASANYGSIALSGTETSTPHLTWAVSHNGGTYSGTGHVIKCYTLAANGLSVSATQTFTYEQLGVPAPVFTSSQGHGNSIFVSQDERTMFIAPCSSEASSLDNPQPAYIYTVEYLPAKTVTTYANNGTSGVGSFSAFTVPGAGATVPECGWTYENHRFTGWNTAADGSGTAYAVGDPLLYGTAPTELYAQWESTASTMSPGEETSTFGDAQQAADWAANVVIIPTPDVATALEAAGVATNTYTAFFTTSVEPSGGDYVVRVVLTETGTNTLQTSANAVATNTVASLAAVAANPANANDVEVTISSDDLTPGFYYSISAAAALTGPWVEGDRVLADGQSISLALPKQTGNAGFYKVLINLAPKPTALP